MIYDCFTFFNELDLLEIRLNTLSDVVDRFVIAEATRTHSGKPKELLFEKNKARFERFADKITYLVVDNLLPEEEVDSDRYNLPWVNENRQRNALARGLAGADGNDVVMVSDLDEIPRPKAVIQAVELLKSGTRFVRFEMDFYNYFLNLRNFSCRKWMLGTSATLVSTMASDDSSLAGVKTDRYTQASENIGNTMNKLRFVRVGKTLPLAGWHFSYLGGIESILRKLAAFAHSEFGNVQRTLLEKRLQAGEDLFGRAGCSYGVRIDSTFPRCVQENLSRWSHLVFPVDAGYLARTKWAKRRAAWRGACYRVLVALVPRRLALLAVRCRDAVMKALGRN